MAGGGPGGHGSGHLRAHVGAAASRTQLGAGVPVPPRTQGGDLLRGDGVGDGLLQQLQAVQDPVAEPGAAGVQTLRGQEAGSWAGSTPNPQLWGTLWGQARAKGTRKQHREPLHLSTCPRATQQRGIRGGKQPGIIKAAPGGRRGAPGQDAGAVPGTS